MIGEIGNGTDGLADPDDRTGAPAVEGRVGVVGVRGVRGAEEDAGEGGCDPSWSLCSLRRMSVLNEGADFFLCSGRRCVVVGEGNDDEVGMGIGRRPAGRGGTGRWLDAAVVEVDGRCG